MKALRWYFFLSLGFFFSCASNQADADKPAAEIEEAIEKAQLPDIPPTVMLNTTEVYTYAVPNENSKAVAVLTNAYEKVGLLGFTNVSKTRGLRGPEWIVITNELGERQFIKNDALFVDTPAYTGMHVPAEKLDEIIDEESRRKYSPESHESMDKNLRIAEMYRKQGLKSEENEYLNEYHMVESGIIQRFFSNESPVIERIYFHNLGKIPPPPYANSFQFYIQFRKELIGDFIITHTVSNRSKNLLVHYIKRKANYIYKPGFKLSGSRLTPLGGGEVVEWIHGDPIEFPDGSIFSIKWFNTNNYLEVPLPSIGSFISLDFFKILEEDEEWSEVNKFNDITRL